MVLSGGGARGMAHIGVIEELEKRGYQITSVAGTSMGSLVGGVYAMGKMEEFKDWLYELDRFKVMKLVDLTLGKQGLVKGDKILTTLQEFISDHKIEELELPYLAVAVDIMHKKEVVIDKGSVYSAIRASISIPTVFTPVKSSDGLLVDGGIMNNIPVNHVARTRGDKLIAVDVNSDVPVDKPEKPDKSRVEETSGTKKLMSKIQKRLRRINPIPENDGMGYFDLLHRTINLMTRQIAQHSMEKNPPDLLIQTSEEACGTFEFFRAEEIVEMGRYAAIKKLDEFEKKKK